MEWELILNGNKNDLDILSEYANSPFLKITKRNKQFILRSCYLSYEENSTEIKRIETTKKLIKAVNGLSKIILNSDENIRTNNANLVDKNGNFYRGCMWIDCSATVRNKIKWENHVKKYINKIDSYSEKILNNENIYRAFIFLQYNKESWRDLYCIYEVIRDTVGTGTGKKRARTGEKFIKKWLPKEEQNRVKIFTQTANSIEAVKEQARHGKAYDAPEIKMSLCEAKELIYKIILKWLDTYP